MTPEADDRAGAEEPLDPSVRAILARTVRRFRDDQMTDRAAALTYYGLLSLFPALISLVSLLGIFGDPQATTLKITEIVSAVGPKAATDTFQAPIDSITSNRGASGVLFFVGLSVAIFSASGYIGAFMRASNLIYGAEEDRPFWKLRPLQFLIALAMVVMLALIAIALVLTGPVIRELADPLGLSDTAIAIWDIAKWPVLAVVFVLMVGTLYYISPNADPGRFRWLTVGSTVALGIWILASAAFAFYVGNFGSYNKTYGALGGVIVLLVWLWISNVAILLGAVLNSEMARSRRISAGTSDEESARALEHADPPEAEN